jgi:hypothetical protein
VSEILNFIAFMIVALFIIYILTQWLLLPLTIEKSLEKIEKAIKDIRK